MGLSLAKILSLGGLIDRGKEWKDWRESREEDFCGDRVIVREQQRLMRRVMSYKFSSDKSLIETRKKRIEASFAFFVLLPFFATVEKKIFPRSAPTSELEAKRRSQRDSEGPRERRFAPPMPVRPRERNWRGVEMPPIFGLPLPEGFLSASPSSRALTLSSLSLSHALIRCRRGWPGNWASCFGHGGPSQSRTIPCLTIFFRDDYITVVSVLCRKALRPRRLYCTLTLSLFLSHSLTCTRAHTHTHGYRVKVRVRECV